MADRMTDTAEMGIVRDPQATAKVVAAWLIVGIPLAWGVAQTVIKSAVLFTR
jgi:hypothetical protein